MNAGFFASIPELDEDYDTAAFSHSSDRRSAWRFTFGAESEPGAGGLHSLTDRQKVLSQAMTKALLAGPDPGADAAAAGDVSGSNLGRVGDLGRVSGDLGRISGPQDDAPGGLVYGSPVHGSAAHSSAAHSSPARAMDPSHIARRLDTPFLLEGAVL